MAMENSGDDGWAVLKTFDSESEARVVESFLRAQGFEVQLLDTHSHGFAPVKGLLKRQGLRLIVRESRLAEAEGALNNTTPTHLDIVTGEPPKIGAGRAEKAIWVLLLLILILMYVLRRGH
jgi:hypothetical protein